MFKLKAELNHSAVEGILFEALGVRRRSGGLSLGSRKGNWGRRSCQAAIWPKPHLAVGEAALSSISPQSIE